MAIDGPVEKGGGAVGNKTDQTNLSVFEAYTPDSPDPAESSFADLDLDSFDDSDLTPFDTGSADINADLKLARELSGFNVRDNGAFSSLVDKGESATPLVESTRPAVSTPEIHNLNFENSLPPMELTDNTTSQPGKKVSEADMTASIERVNKKLATNSDQETFTSRMGIIRDRLATITSV
ncbi:MAG: hypothetical protein K8F91_15000 [Candidatus Obscuribacterales bacterium]|nr:hypothetical protein [Candidatus Obscuribacterales bacterium]